MNVPVPQKEPFYSNDAFLILSLLCCWPIGLIFMWAGQKWSLGARIAITAIFVVITAFGMLADPPKPQERSRPSESSAAPEETEAPKVAKPVKPAFEFVSESCKELSATFGASSKLSELQKKELWKDYRGKAFDWKLKVSEVHPGVFSGFVVQYYCAPGTDSLLFDIQVEYDREAKQHVLGLMKGETYQVRGVLKRSGSIMGMSADAIVE